MPRAEIIASKSLAGRRCALIRKDMEEACAASNRIAPEHLEVSSTDPHRWEPLLRHAGAIFLGPTPAKAWATTAPAPTTCCPPAARRVSSPLGVYDFQKRSSPH